MEDQTFLNLFTEKLQKLYNLFSSHPSKRVNGEFIKEYTQGMSDEEKEIVEDACEYVDIYYQKRKELEECGKDPVEWLEEDIEATARELQPDASAEDIKELKEAVAAGIEKRTEIIVDVLDCEMTPVSTVLNEKGGEA